MFLSVRSYGSWLVAVCILLGSADAAFAQYPGYPPRRGQKPQPPQPVANFKGTITGVMRGELIINSTTMAMLAPNGKIQVIGKAEPEFLRSGLCVQFSAEVDRQGKTTKGRRSPRSRSSRQETLGINEGGGGEI